MVDRDAQLLLIEDDDTYAHVVRHLLSPPEGTWHVDRAATLLAGLERLTRPPAPACILLDLGLPDGSPSVALHAIRAAAGAIPVVAITNHDPRHFGEAARQLAGWVSKLDLREDALERAIRAAIGSGGQTAAHGALLVEAGDGLDEVLLASLQGAGTPMALVALDGTILFANPALASLVGTRPERLAGVLVDDLFEGDHANATTEFYDRVLQPGGPLIRLDRTLRFEDGPRCDVQVAVSLVRHRDGTPRLFLGEVVDSRVATPGVEDLPDGVTGLPSLGGWRRSAADLVSRLEGEQRVAVIVADVDHFRLLARDDAGARLLREIADRFVLAAPRGAAVARLGDDSFAIASRAADDAEADAIAERLRLAAAAPAVVNERLVVPTASFGVRSVVRGDTGDPNAWLRQALDAVRVAKSHGRNRAVRFDLDEAVEHDRRARVQQELRLALARGELRLHYQPTVDLRTGGISGAEALLRWEHEEHGLLGPEAFLDDAEQTDLILQLGRWALEEAVRTRAAWSDHPVLGAVPVSVNVSAREVVPGYADHVRAVLGEHELDPGAIVLELTETALVDDEAAGGSELASLRAAGVQLALDDFGTGFTCLRSLRQANFDAMKLDRSYVAHAGDGGPDDMIVTTMVQLAQRLGLATVAEGIEEEAIADRMSELGCDMGQGWLWSRPLPAAELEALRF